MFATTDSWLVVTNIAVAIGTLFLGAMAWWSIRSNEKILREQNRPYIFIENKAERDVAGKTSLPIRNSGLTAALDVTVSVSRSEGNPITKSFNYIAPQGMVWLTTRVKGRLNIEISYNSEWGSTKSPQYNHRYCLEIGDTNITLS